MPTGTLQSRTGAARLMLCTYSKAKWGEHKPPEGENILNREGATARRS